MIVLATVAIPARRESHVTADRTAMGRTAARRRAARRELLGRAGDRYLEIVDHAGRQRIDPAMDRHILSPCPCLEEKHVRSDVADLPDDVELAQSVQAGVPVVDRLELGPVLPVYLAD